MRKNKVFYLSLASVLSAFAVVMLHTNGCFWIFSTDRYWATANIIESVMYFAVPVFFMISGATLIDYRDRYTTKEYFVKRIQKTVIPFLIWSCIAVIYRVIKGTMIIEPTFESLQSVILGIANAKILTVFWFFISLFSVYLCIPVISAINKELRERVFLYAIGAAFLFNYLIPFLCQVFSISYTSRVSVPIAGDYLIYVFIGYVLNRREIKRFSRFIIYVAGVIGLLIHLIGTYVLSIEAGMIVQTYKGYTKLPCLIYSVAIFVALKEIGNRITSEKAISLVEWLSGYTFPVYLMHYLVMDALIMLLDINTRSIIYRVGAPVVIFAVCIGITWCIRKIPGLRKIVP